MRRSLEVSRRQFLHTSTTVAAATIVATTGPAGAGEPPVQAPPPASTAPRVLRKPPLGELKRIAGAYGVELSQVRGRFWFYPPAFHFASGQISGTSLPL